MRKPVLLLLFFLATAMLSAGSRSEEPQALDTVAAVRALTREQAAGGHPVRIEGVVTYHEPLWFLTFVQDHTGGIYVSARTARLNSGDRVVVTGVTAPGSVGRIIVGAQGTDATVEVTGRGALPDPIKAEPALLMDDTYDAQWVSVEGEVWQVQRVNDRAILQLAMGGGKRINVLVPGFGEDKELPGYFRLMRVSVTGVVGTATNERGEFVASTLQVPSLEQVVIDPALIERKFRTKPASANAFYNTGSAARGEPLHFRGLVLFIRPGRGFFMALQEEEERWNVTLWVRTSLNLAIEEGQMVDVIATPEISAGRPQLRDAIVWPGEWKEHRGYEELSAAEITADHHARLVETEATLLEHRRALSEEFLVLSSGRGVVCVRLSLRPGERPFPSFKRGSLLRVKGICVDRPPEVPAQAGQPFSFEIWVRHAGDVQLLRQPAWWTPERIGWALGATGVLATLAFGWAMLLKRKVRAQTKTIRQQLERETRHEERTRIAREFHDTLEQHFAGISMQLDAIAATVKSGSSETHEMVRLAREMARHSRDEARHVIWELRAPTLGSASFCKALRRKLEPVARRAGLRLQVTESGQPQPLPSVLENHLLRIAQEALTNTMKHAEAGEVKLTLDYGLREVTLRIVDDGRGLPQDPGEPAGFGLCGMRERVDRMNGTLEVESRSGAGVAVTARVPIAATHFPS